MRTDHSKSTASYVPADPTEVEVYDCCIHYLAGCLKLPAELIDPHSTFARLGVDSATSVFLLMELEERLGDSLPSDILFENPTIAQLARYVSEYRRSTREANRGPQRG